MVERSALVLGLGNDLLSDDGFGPAVVDEARVRFSHEPGTRFETAAAGGFRLLDLLAGVEDLLIIDVVQTGLWPPGTVGWWPVSSAEVGRTLGAGHGLDLPTALRLGGLMGWSMPGRVDLLVAEASDLETIHEGLTANLRPAVNEAVRLVADWFLSRRQQRQGTRCGKVGMPITKPCEQCAGRGWVELHCTRPDEATVCSGCNGSGTLPSGRACWGCHGTGRIETRTVEQQRCAACHGTGVFPVPEAM